MSIDSSNWHLVDCDWEEKKIGPETNENLFNDFTEKIQARLRKKVKSLPGEYIPEEHLKEEMVNDIAYTIQDFIYAELVDFFKKFRISTL